MQKNHPWARTIPTGAWPDRLPDALRLRLADALSYRACGPDDLWDVLTDWFADEGIAAPARLLIADRAADRPHAEPGSVKFGRAVQ